MRRLPDTGDVSVCEDLVVNWTAGILGRQTQAGGEGEQEAMEFFHRSGVFEAEGRLPGRQAGDSTICVLVVFIITLERIRVSTD
jgi:hypothetical protein